MRMIMQNETLAFFVFSVGHKLPTRMYRRMNAHVLAWV